MNRRSRLVIAAAIAVSAVLHCAPIVVLWQATGRRLPAWSSADPYLYLTLSRVQLDGQGSFRNPWYGIQGSAGGVEHLHFRLPLRLFHWLSVAAGDEGRALIAWHFLLNVAIGIAFLWMLRPMTRDPSALALALLAVMLVEATAAVDLAQIRSGRLVWIYGLPFFRAFSPQISIPMIALAVGAMLRWLQDGRSRWLALIVLLQFAGFITFPFSGPVILGSLVLSTCAAAILGVAGKRQRLVILAVCASVAIDALWFWSTGSPSQIGGTRPLLGFDPALLHFGRPLRTPVLLGLAILALPRLDRKVRAVLSALALAIGLAQLSDAFVTPALNLGGHFDYFYGLAASAAMIAIILSVHATIEPRRWRIASGVAAGVILIVAVLQTRAMIAVWRPYNVANGQLAGILESLHAGEGDVVAMPVHGFRTGRPPAYWEASWVPLVSRATVLYSRAGGFGLPPSSQEQPNRLAAYLFLAGEDAKSLQMILTGPPDSREQHFLAGWEREGVVHEPSTRVAALAELGQELLPKIIGLGRGSTPPFLGSARRIIVADYRVDPVFRADRIARLIAVDQVLDSGEWRIRIGHPR